MKHRHGPPQHDPIPLLDGVVEFDANVRKSRAKISPELLEMLRAANGGAVLRLAVTDGVLRAHRIDGRLVTAVPNFFEPLPDQVCIAGHVASLDGETRRASRDDRMLARKRLTRNRHPLMHRLNLSWRC